MHRPHQRGDRRRVERSSQRRQVGANRIVTFVNIKGRRRSRKGRGRAGSGVVERQHANSRRAPYAESNCRGGVAEQVIQQSRCGRVVEKSEAAADHGPAGPESVPAKAEAWGPAELVDALESIALVVSDVGAVDGV